jgi:GTPase SAR1 family protein
VILIGNKNDLASKREVSEDEALDFAKKNNLDYIECSAFNSLNISLVFEAIVKKVLRERGRWRRRRGIRPAAGPTSTAAGLIRGRRGRRTAADA